MRGVVESLPDGVAMNRELLQWWWWTGGGCVPPGPGSVTPARCNEALRCELQRSLEEGKLPRRREIQGPCLVLCLVPVRFPRKESRIYGGLNEVYF